MQARSIEIDLQGQKKILGRVAMTNNEQAESYIEIVNADDRLLEVIRKVHGSGDLKPLLDDRQGSAPEQGRRKRLLLILGVASERRAP